MKKILFLSLLLGSSLCINAMHLSKLSVASNKQLPFKFASKRLYSTQNNFKPIGALSLPEVEKLADNKKRAQEYLQLALLRDEDCECNTAISHQPNDIKNLWKKVFNQFSIQDWNSMFLAREEHSILETINPDILNFIKKINFKELASAHYYINDDSLIAYIARALKGSNVYNDEFPKKFYAAKPLEESIQHDYQTNLQNARYPKMPGLIYQWNYNLYGPACSIDPHIYVTSDFFNFPLEERLAILATEDQRRENFHTLKQISILSFLKKENLPTIYIQFMQKEADLKASAYNIKIAAGLLNYFMRMKVQKERIHALENLIDKLDKEKKNYCWNPFYKIVGHEEYFKGWHHK